MAERNCLIGKGHRRLEATCRRARAGVCRTVLVLCACCATSEAAAGLYKCAGRDGVPVYQEAPCPRGSELRNLDAEPPTLSVVPAPPPAPQPKAARPAKTRAAGSTRRVDRPGPWKTNPSPDPAERRHAYVGMSEGKVLAKLGRPDLRSGGGRKGKVLWTYLPVPGDAETVTTLSVENGIVIYVDRRTVKR